MRGRRIDWLRRAPLLALCVFVLWDSAALPASEGTDAKVAAVDAGAGPCSVEFTVKDAKGAPVYSAKVRVHIAYGFMGMRKLDLEVGTNSQGNARFDGLPDKVKQALIFHASEGGREGSVSYAPSKNCASAHETIALQTSSGDSN